MRKTSKDLLHLEHNNSSTSATESALLVCNKKNSHHENHQPEPGKKLVTAPVPQSQVMGKVKDFLSIMSEANKRLELDAKDNSQAYDIEVLDGNESQVIEMDLMLGVADLNTPEAVAAAESAIAGNQPVTPLATSSSESSESDSDTDSNEESDDDVNNTKETSSPLKLKISKTGKSISSSKSTTKKRPRIIELS